MNVLALGGASHRIVTMTNLEPFWSSIFRRRFFKKKNAKENISKKAYFCFDTKTEFWIKWFYFQVYSSQGSSDIQTAFRTASYRDYTVSRNSLLDNFPPSRNTTVKTNFVPDLCGYILLIFKIRCVDIFSEPYVRSLLSLGLSPSTLNRFTMSLFGAYRLALMKDFYQKMQFAKNHLI